MPYHRLSRSWPHLDLIFNSKIAKGKHVTASALFSGKKSGVTIRITARQPKAPT